MARYNDFAKVTPAALRSLAATIRTIADAHDRLAGWMDADSIESVDAKLMKTEVDALAGHCKFLAEVFQAYQEAGCIAGISELAGAVAHLKKQTGRVRDGVRVAFFEDEAAVARLQEERIANTVQQVGEGIAKSETLGRARKKPVSKK